MKNNLPLEKIASKIAALGVPGLILSVAIGATGLAGAAAITTALAALGPAGIFGGIMTLAVASIIADGIVKYGSEAIISAVIKELYLQGETKESLITKIERYWISKELRLKLIDMINQFS